MNEKVIGYIMASVGVLVIIACALLALNVFITRLVPIHFVSLGKISINLGVPGGGELAGVKPELGIPSDSIDFGLNLAIYLFILGFIANMGFKLASLGVMLARPIVVDLKNARNEDKSKPSG